MNIVITLTMTIGLMIIIVLQEKHIAELSQDNIDYREAVHNCIQEVYDNMHNLEQQMRALEQDLYLLQNGYKHYYDGDDE